MEGGECRFHSCFCFCFLFIFIYRNVNSWNDPNHPETKDFSDHSSFSYSGIGLNKCTPNCNANKQTKTIDLKLWIFINFSIWNPPKFTYFQTNNLLGHQTNDMNFWLHILHTAVYYLAGQRNNACWKARVQYIHIPLTQNSIKTDTKSKINNRNKQLICQISDLQVLLYVKWHQATFVWLVYKSCYTVPQ